MAKITQTAKETKKIIYQRRGLFTDLVVAVFLVGIAIILAGME